MLGQPVTHSPTGEAAQQKANVWEDLWLNFRLIGWDWKAAEQESHTQLKRKALGHGLVVVNSKHLMEHEFTRASLESGYFRSFKKIQNLNALFFFSLSKASQQPDTK